MKFLAELGQHAIGTVYSYVVKYGLLYILPFRDTGLRPPACYRVIKLMSVFYLMSCPGHLSGFAKLPKWMCGAAHETTGSALFLEFLYLRG